MSFKFNIGVSCWFKVLSLQASDDMFQLPALKRLPKHHCSQAHTCLVAASYNIRTLRTYGKRVHFHSCDLGIHILGIQEARTGGTRCFLFGNFLIYASGCQQGNLGWKSGWIAADCERSPTKM